MERDGSEYTVAEDYNLSLYIGKPGQAMEVSEVAGLRLDEAFCEATSREHGTVYFLRSDVPRARHGLLRGVQQPTRALRAATERRRRAADRFQLGDSARAARAPWAMRSIDFARVPVSLVAGWGFSRRM